MISSGTPPSRPSPRAWPKRITRKIAWAILSLERKRTRKGMVRVHMGRKALVHQTREMAVVRRLLDDETRSPRSRTALARYLERLEDRYNLAHYDLATAWKRLQRKRVRAKGLSHLVTLRPYSRR